MSQAPTVAARDLHPALVRADARARLADALDVEPEFLDAAPGDYEVWKRGPLVFLLPSVPPWPRHAEVAVLAARSPWLTRACELCHRQLYVTRTGAVRVQHAAKCPGGRAAIHLKGET